MGLAKIGKEALEAKLWLEKGEVIGIPTETVYGLAGNALNDEAVVKIFSVKDRPHFNPLIVHIASFDQISQYVEEIPVLAYRLAEKFWPGPLTMLLAKSDSISDLVTAGSAKVAIRVPGHPLTLELLQNLNYPLAAPSANPFGYISPTSAEHVMNQLGDKIPYILDGGPSTVGLESTIISFEEDKVIIHRLGGLGIEAIEETAAKVELRNRSNLNPESSGKLKSHYAPATALVQDPPEVLLKKHPPEKIGVIAFTDSYPSIPQNNQQILSQKGDINEAAKNLFAALRYLDQQTLDIIYAEQFPNEGLGRAINDRLERGLARNKDD